MWSSLLKYIENKQIHQILDHEVPPPTPFEIESVKYVGYLAADDADYDNGTHGDTNDNATETSQRVRGSNLVQSIPSHPSQRPMITLYYGGFAEGHITRDIISIFKVSFYGSWTSWREVDQESRDIMFEEFQDQYQWHPSENAAVYRAWEKVMSSRFSDILGACRREAALRATEDNIKVGNDLSVLKPYTPSWIDQADWEDMINRVWNTSRWKKKSAIARQNRLSEVDGEVSKHTAGSITILQHKFKMEKQKQRPVSLLEAYQYTHTQETAEALGNGTDEGSGDGTDEAVGSGTREYITRRSKRVADAVEAAMEDEHGPDASQHPPNDFDLWGRPLGGRRKVQNLEEMVRQLQEDNARMKARSEIEMQVQVQRQVESQLQEHMRQRELELNAREEAREREWQRKMDDINLMLKKINDPRPPQ
ncbi:transposase, Ptta/En/Spm [Tanacetum coccineum]